MTIKSKVRLIKIQDIGFIRHKSKSINMIIQILEICLTKSEKVGLSNYGPRAQGPK